MTWARIRHLVPELMPQKYLGPQLTKALQPTPLDYALVQETTTKSPDLVLTLLMRTAFIRKPRHSPSQVAIKKTYRRAIRDQGLTIPTMGFITVEKKQDLPFPWEEE